MASYENDLVIKKVLDGENCAIAEANLIDLLKELPGGPAKGQVFTEADLTKSGAFTKGTIDALRTDSPEVMLFEVNKAGAPKRINLNLTTLGNEVKEIKGLFFDTDRGVTIKGLQDFAGVIDLTDQNDRVSASKATGDITVCTGDGNDSVMTGSGKDSINIGSGKDSVSTGSGNDVIRFTGTDTTGGKVNAGAGNDQMFLESGFKGGAGVKITLDGGKDNDTLDLGSFVIDSVQKSGSGVKITLADDTVLIVKNVESFKVGSVTVVGVQDLIDLFAN